MKVIIACLLVVFSIQAGAQSVEVNDSDDANPPMQNSPETGKAKAKQYFQSRKGEKAAGATVVEGGAAPHILALQIGTFFSDNSYKWGDSDHPSTGKLNAGVTYRMGEWVNSMDFSIRIEYTDFDFGNGVAKAISFSPIITFPDANSRFPLYFGAGVGAGLFVQQVHDRSPISLDWQVVVGARFFDVFEKIGFVVETGMKNHVLLFSEGQDNAVFVNVG